VIIVITCVFAIAAIAFILGVRAKDLPLPEPVSPFQHLDERKAAIYENLRDLQFEYRVGKLSDADYQATKKDLQKELAGVMAEVDKIKLQLNGAGQTTAPSQSNNKKTVVQPVATSTSSPYVCDSCGAGFDTPLKFCGECGKPMKVAK
jgi:rRNA maturation endonuclease Nob1